MGEDNFIIFDVSGNSVSKKIDELRVVNEERVIRKFDELNLKEEDYSIELVLKYGGVDNFNKNFIIKMELNPKLRIGLRSYLNE